MTSEENTQVGFGDNIRVRVTQLTKEKGIAGLTGDVRGETTPSVTGVEVIGELTEDYALNVQLEQGDDFWIVPGLLELIDHAPGTVMIVGNVKTVRQEDGSWEESRVRPWWKFW